MNSEDFDDDDLKFLDEIEFSEDEELSVDDNLFFKGAGEEDIKDLFLNKEEALDYLLILMQ